jgi:catechol 2,3-dioxygenase-like lactoylglutathione lyase family enzyme
VTRLGPIVIDCADPERLAGFWGALLGEEVWWRKGPYVGLRGAATHLLFQRVGESKSGKNRVHPDLFSDDVRATEARVIELGGARVAGYEAGGFLVMADPEGNEFCVIPEGEWELDDEGNAHYL